MAPTIALTLAERAECAGGPAAIAPLSSQHQRSRVPEHPKRQSNAQVRMAIIHNRNPSRSHPLPLLLPLPIALTLALPLFLLLLLLPVAQAWSDPKPNPNVTSDNGINALSSGSNPKSARLQPWPLALTLSGACCSKFLSEARREILSEARQEGSNGGRINGSSGDGGGSGGGDTDGGSKPDPNPNINPLPPPIAQCFASAATKASDPSYTPTRKPTRNPASSAVTVISYSAAIPSDAGHFAVTDIWKVRVRLGFGVLTFAYPIRP